MAVLRLYDKRRKERERGRERERERERESAINKGKFKSEKTEIMFLKITAVLLREQESECLRKNALVSYFKCVSVFVRLLICVYWCLSVCVFVICVLLYYFRCFCVLVEILLKYT